MLKREVLTNILLEVLFGKSSDFYLELYEKGLINATFSKDCSLEPQFGFTALGGESPNPEEVYDRVERHIASVLRTGVDKSAVARARKVLLGKHIRLFNDVGRMGNEFVRNVLNDVNPFDVMDVEVTTEDVEERLREHFRGAAMAIVESA